MNLILQNFNSKNLLPQSFLYILDNYYVPIFKELDCGFPPDPSIAQKIEIFKYFESKDEAYE